jgi:hypothetical protein
LKELQKAKLTQKNHELTVEVGILYLFLIEKKKQYDASLMKKDFNFTVYEHTEN